MPFVVPALLAADQTEWKQGRHFVAGSNLVLGPDEERLPVGRGHYASSKVYLQKPYLMMEQTMQGFFSNTFRQSG